MSNGYRRLVIAGDVYIIKITEATAEAKSEKTKAEAAVKA